VATAGVSQVIDQLSKYPSRNLFRSQETTGRGDVMDSPLPFWKCNACKLMNIPQTALRPNGKGTPELCPDCGAPAIIQCNKDKVCRCGREIHGGIKFCPVCGNPICPGCGSHDVLSISRITGYMQDVAGWNAGKAQELKERKRYDLS
jgi:hypothetical protein